MAKKNNNLVIRESNEMVEHDYVYMSPFVDKVKQFLIEKLRSIFFDIVKEVNPDQDGIADEESEQYKETIKRLLVHSIQNSEIDPGNKHPQRVKDAFDYIQKTPHVLYGDIKKKGNAYQFTIISDYKWDEENKVHNIRLNDSCIRYFLPKNNFTQYDGDLRLTLNRVTARVLYVLGCKWYGSAKQSFSLSELEMRLKFGSAQYKKIEDGFSKNNIEITLNKDFRYYVRNVLNPSLSEIYQAFVDGRCNFWLEMVPKRATPDGRGAPPIIDYDFKIRTTPRKIEDVSEEELAYIKSELQRLERYLCKLFAHSNAKDGFEKAAKGLVKNISLQTLSPVNPKLWLIGSIIKDCNEIFSREVGRAPSQGKSMDDPEVLTTVARKTRSTLKRKYGITSK